MINLLTDESNINKPSLHYPHAEVSNQSGAKQKMSSYVAKKQKERKEAALKDPSKLVQQGNLALSNFQPELASQFFEKAVALAPEDTNIMDALADTYIQIGRTTDARDLLIRSVTLAPEVNPYKWLFLAQCQSGMDAYTTYNRAIEILGAVYTSMEEGSAEKLGLQLEVSKAYSSIAELFLTDLCYEDGAEENCERAVQQCLLMNPESLDGLQALASLRLSQNRPADAVEVIKMVYSKIHSIYEVSKQRTVLEDIAQAVLPAELEDLPEFDFMIGTSKILIECGRFDPELMGCANELLNDLMEENDENIELWYLLGVCSLSSSPPDAENAKYYLESAYTMLNKLKENCARTGEVFEYEDQESLIMEHMAMLGSAVEGSGASGDGGSSGAAGGGGGADEDEEEWTDDDDDDGEEGDM